MISPIKLGINVDHVATLRQARLTRYPDPVQAGLMAQKAGADSITVHLREDRRHIQETDVIALKEQLDIPLNLEMAATPEMLGIAENIRPDFCCLVPEKRQELTTEGGLDIIAMKAEITDACERLKSTGIKVSLFIDPDLKQIDASHASGAQMVELHTGTYANLAHEAEIESELYRITQASGHAEDRQLQVNAGHGLTIENVIPIVEIHQIVELNIGHSIVSRALFLGLEDAVKEMKTIMDDCREKSNSGSE